MKVTSADIVISAVKPEQYPESDMPEIALAGRSNVGKSSFINKMLNRKSLATNFFQTRKNANIKLFILLMKVFILLMYLVMAMQKSQKRNVLHGEE